MDLLPLLRSLQIVDKDRGVVDFDPNWAQRHILDTVHAQYNADKPVRIIVLKARQLGVTTVAGAVMFSWSFLFHNNRSLVVSHEIPSSEHILAIANLYWETCPWKAAYTTKWHSKNNLHWRQNNSAIDVVTAKNLSAGRSRTIHLMHGSEVGFWPDAKTLMTGLRKTIPDRPGTAIILESTANGVGGWFYDTWCAAEAGENDYAPLFFPWWCHPQYRGSVVGATKPLGRLDDEERSLKVLLRTGLTVGHLVYEGLNADEIDDALRWRRHAIRNECGGDINDFHQEYPSTPEEAFVATGNNIFPATDLKAIYAPGPEVKGFLLESPQGPKFLASPDGPLTIFKHPGDRPDCRYFVGGDPTHTMRGDPACAQVINRRTGEQVAVLHKRVDPFYFATDLHYLARYYNDAIISTESTGPGYATIGALVQMGYPYLWRSKWADKTPGSIAETFGFQTNVQRKHGAIGHLLALMVQRGVTVHDRKTYAQLRNYVRLDSGKFGPVDDEGNDDAVMALAIALYCNYLEPPLPAVGQERADEAPWETWQAGADVLKMFADQGAA